MRSSHSERAILGAGAINTRGRQVRDRLHRMEFEVGIPRDVDPDTLTWFEEGDAIVEALAQIVHGEADARLVDERAVRSWQSIGRQAERSYQERMARLGKAVRKSGLGDEEAAEAIRRGELPLD